MKRCEAPCCFSLALKASVSPLGKREGGLFHLESTHLEKEVKFPQTHSFFFFSVPCVLCDKALRTEMGCLSPETLPTEGPGTPRKADTHAGSRLISTAKLTKPPRVPGDTLFLGSVGLGKGGPQAGNGSEQQRPHTSRHKKTQEHKHIETLKTVFVQGMGKRRGSAAAGRRALGKGRLRGSPL